MVEKQYILCSAIWVKGGDVHEEQPSNIDSGFVICGRRHSNCYLTGYAFMGKKKFHEDHKTVIAGFITNDNLFVDRIEGAEIAFAAGQTDKKHDVLISECLYYP